MAKTAPKKASRKRDGAAAGGRAQGHRAYLSQRAILESAARLFAERGYGGTSLQDLAVALGISRPLLYYYFSSKEKLLEALVEEVTVSSLRQSTEIVARTQADPVETLRLLVLSHAKWLLSHGTLFRVVDRSEKELPERLAARHEEAKRALLNNFTQVIEHGIEIGQFRPVDARVAAFSLIGMCSWTAWWFNPEGRSSGEAVAAQLGEFAVNMLQRLDSFRARSNQVEDVLRILKEDVQHLERLIDAAKTVRAPTR